MRVDCILLKNEFDKFKNNSMSLKKEICNCLICGKHTDNIITKHEYLCVHCKIQYIMTINYLCIKLVKSNILIEYFLSPDRTYKYYFKKPMISPFYLFN